MEQVRIPLPHYRIPSQLLMLLIILQRNFMGQMLQFGEVGREYLKSFISLSEKGSPEHE